MPNIIKGASSNFQIKDFFLENKHQFELTTFVGILAALFLQVPRGHGSSLKILQALFIMVFCFMLIILISIFWGHVLKYLRSKRKRNDYVNRAINLSISSSISICFVFLVLFLFGFIIEEFSEELRYLATIVGLIFAPTLLAAFLHKFRQFKGK